jgi:predicted nucleic acid-binding protein
VKVFIDTGGFAALYNQRDDKHEQAKTVWNRIREERPQLFTSNDVVSETITLLRNRSGFKEAVEFGNALFSTALVRVLHVTNTDQANAWTLFKKYDDHHLSFVDCTSFALMRDHHISQAFAFDADFSTFGFELLD